MSLEPARAFVQGIERRDRLVYGLLAASLVLFVVLPHAATALAWRLVPPRTTPELQDPDRPGERPPEPERSGLERAAIAIASHDLALQTFANGMFVLLVALLGTWEVGKRAWARLRAPRRTFGEEIAFSARLSLLPGSVLAIAGTIVLDQLHDLSRPASEVVLVPLPLAVAATCYALSFSAILFVRLTRTDPDEQV